MFGAVEETVNLVNPVIANDAGIEPGTVIQTGPLEERLQQASTVADRVKQEREQELRAPLQPLGHEAALLLQFPQRAVSDRLARVELASEPVPLADAEAALLHAEQELALVVHGAEALDERVVLDAADRLAAVLARAPPDLVVERRVGGERAGSIYQIIKLAAEACPRNLSHRVSGTGQGVRVDQPGCLIVCDQTDTLSLGRIMRSKAGHGCGLART